MDIINYIRYCIMQSDNIVTPRQKMEGGREYLQMLR